MSSVLAESGIVLVDTPNALKAMVAKYLERGTPLAFDIETTGLDPRTGKLITLQFYQRGGNVAVIDARNNATTSLLTLSLLSQSLRPLFAGDLLVLGHNLKFDFGWLMEHLSIFPARCFDTFLAEQVILGLGRSDATAQGIELNLKAVASKRLGIAMSKEERNWFIDLDTREEWYAPLPTQQVEYGAADVRLLPDLYDNQLLELKRRGLVKPARLEMDALPAITTIEHSGVMVNVEGWRAFIAEKEVQAKEIESKALEVFGSAILSARAKKFDEQLAVYNAFKAAETEHARLTKEVFYPNRPHHLQDEPWGKFKQAEMKSWREDHPTVPRPKPDTSTPNLSSPAQLSQAFHEMGIDAPSTASEVLERLEDEYPAVRLLLDYRRTSKFVTSFGESLLRFISAAGRIHPEYVQIGASTGRMSCTRPNWQQVPSKGDGKKLRSLVVAPPGNVLLTADFSNVELRILADISGDRNMLKLFSQGLDLHSYTARMMFGLDESVDVAHETLPGSDKTYRFVAKTINFGLVYGMSPTKLAKTVKVPVEQARNLMDAYFRLYPGVKAWMAEQRELGTSRLYSTTLSGRKRYFSLPKLDGSVEGLEEYRKAKARIERQAMNTPIQGTSADITKQALVNLYRSGMLQNWTGKAKIVAVVHDEIVLECLEADAPVVAESLKQAMGDAARQYLKVVTMPDVDVVISDHWSKE